MHGRCSKASRVFISYRHAEPDQALAAELERHLVEEGLEVFTDQRIEVGTRWVEEIERQRIVWAAPRINVRPENRAVSRGFRVVWVRREDWTDLGALARAVRGLPARR